MTRPISPLNILISLLFFIISPCCEAAPTHTLEKRKGGRGGGGGGGGGGGKKSGRVAGIVGGAIVGIAVFIYIFICFKRCFSCCLDRCRGKKEEEEEVKPVMVIIHESDMAMTEDQSGASSHEEAFDADGNRSNLDKNNPTHTV